MKTAMKRVALVGAAAMLGLSACASNPAPEAPQAPTASTTDTATAGACKFQDGHELHVGVIYQDLSNEFIAIEKDAMVEAAAKELPNVKFSWLDGEGDPAKQITQVDSLLSQNIDVLLLNAQDGVQLAPSAKKAIDAGVPVIALGTDVEGDFGQVWIGSENEHGGELQMQYLVDRLDGKGRIAILRGPIGHFAEIGRMAGYQKVLDANPGIEVVFDQSAEFRRELGMSTMENWLQTGEQLDGVLAQNDEMILGAAQAVQAAGKGDQIILVGLDGIPDALEAVKNGTLAATLYQDAVAVGQKAIGMTKTLLDCGSIEWTDVPFELVVPDNVDEFINRGK